MSCARNLFLLLFMLALVSAALAESTNTLIWHKDTGTVSADVHGEPLWPLLQDIGRQTGWHILIEPGVDHLADAKFGDVPTGDALRKLLGDLNFALVPQTNGPDFLYIFMTTLKAATRPVAANASKSRHVANQLLVKLKPGADIDALAKSLGAKVIGRDDKLHLYLLQFSNSAATDTALAQLQTNSDVESVSYNNIFDPPPTPQAIDNAPVSPPRLTLDATTPNNPCAPVIGLIDTQVQSMGNGLDQFVETPISVVGNVNPVTGTITHGTAMAQRILGAVAQVTGGHSSSKILPVNVYVSGDSTTTWNVALGVQAAVDNGATILNMSLGSSDNSAVLADVIQQAQAQGVVIFASAGNTPVTTPTYPAAYAGVNAVTALGAPGQLASYANYGSFVEMALPGSSFAFLGSQAYIVQGTSPAAAYATGIAVGTKNVNCGSWSQIEGQMAQQYPVPAPSSGQ